ncbi:hypothetical protein BDP81DRAFT_478845 [Colletotrichum phormii]|uniref:FAD-binding domain-containing protein n=1 Tax=Colletotrichum phormii TaxID=359342 RepID=A0AAJ0A090_9PEZI|nr:uncharacterized protein BDP81DRAFT_478845 [Colletotrichum phormii]KAK1641495.1 hypothetical protein BDP81DRAFT_478845 [Colletotrichum phormii]
MGLKVIIACESIFSLPLAKMLEQFDIEYILLEPHSTIAPQFGASIGLLPNGLRILDQLVCYEKIKEAAGDVSYRTILCLFSGNTWTDTQPVSFSQLGYPQIFVDRKTLQQVLFDKFKFKDRVLTTQVVVSVDLLGEQATFHTQDASVHTVHTGDIVFGADGVHSAIRGEMHYFAVSDFHLGLQSESECIFGVSKRPTGLPGTAIQVNSFFKSCNYMVLSAPNNSLYWFLFTSFARLYGKAIPEFTKEYKLALAENHFDEQVTETFRDIHANRLQTTLVALAGHVFPRSYFQGVLIIGKAAHKFLFTEVQAKRFIRAEAAETFFFSRVLVDYFFTRLSQSLIWGLIIKNMETGPTIDDIPIPKRCEKAVIRHRETTNKRSWSFWSLVTLGPGILTLLQYSTISWIRTSCTSRD